MMSLEEAIAIENVGGTTAAVFSAAGNSASAATAGISLMGLMGFGVLILFQFLQIVGFYSAFVFFNVKYSYFVKTILTSLYTTLDQKMMVNPFATYATKDWHSVWIYRAKVSEIGLPCFMLEDAGPEINLVLICYALNVIFTVFLKPDTLPKT